MSFDRGSKPGGRPPKPGAQPSEAEAKPYLPGGPQPDPFWHMKDPMRRVRAEREAAGADIRRAVAWRKAQRAEAAHTQPAATARAPIAAKLEPGVNGPPILRSPKTAAPPLTAVPIWSRGHKQEDTALAHLGEQSMAKNPRFEADAIAFEQKLGKLAFGHPAAHAAAQDMSHKAKAYLMDKAGGRWDAASKELQLMARQIGSDEVAWSGSVGKAVRDVMAVFDSGNVAERMAHVSNFFIDIMGNDFLEQNTRTIQQRMQKCRMDYNIVRDRHQEMRANGLAGRGSKWEIAPVPERLSSGQRNPTADQWHTRADRALGHGIPREDKSGKQLFNHTRNVLAQSGHTAAEMGAQMSGREVALHQQAQPGWDPQKDHVMWAEGTRLWVMNEADQWVQKQRRLSLPLGAGPSGSTNTIMQAAVAFGSNLLNARAATIAYLLPARHHTLVEILAGAAPFGCEYLQDHQMYRRISPFTEDELRACGKEGKFPDELQVPRDHPMPNRGQKQ